MKSDDVVGRVKTYEAIVKGENIPEPGVPESFKVLVKELQSLCLDVKVISDEAGEVEIRETEDESDFRSLGVNIEGIETGEEDEPVIRHQEILDHEEDLEDDDLEEEVAGGEISLGQNEDLESEQDMEEDQTAEPEHSLEAVEIAAMDEVSLEQLEDLEQDNDENYEDDLPAKKRAGKQ